MEASDSSHQPNLYPWIEGLDLGESFLPSYNKHIVELIVKFLGSGLDPNPVVVDFGAGLGTLAELFFGRTGFLPICIEPDPRLQAALVERGFEVRDDIGKMISQVDFVYSSNVLEHILDDVSILEDIYTALRPDGGLAIYVPAMPFLFSELDERVGHVRRYTRKDLLSKIKRAGFSVHHWSYRDSLGVPGSIALKVFGYNSSGGLGSPGTLKFYDKVLFPISKVVDRLTRKAFGKNLFVVARKTP